MASDAELLAEWRAGSRDAGTALFRRHFPAVFRFFQTKVSGDVEELVQRTFLACLEAGERLDDVRNFRAYLYGICRFQLLRYLEEKNRGAKIEDLVRRSAYASTTSPSRLVLAHQEQDLLLRALRRIPLDLQIALELFYWEQMPQAEMALVLEIPEGTVKSRIFRAKKLLKEQIDVLDADPALRMSTIDGLDQWARGLRDQIEVPAEPSGSE